MSRIGSAWVAKTGNSTAEISSRWEESILSGSGGLLPHLQRAQGPIGDPTVDRLVSLPGSIGSRPLIPGVVVSELVAQGILRRALPAYASEELGALLGREWVRTYAKDLGAVVLRDLGGSLPNVRSFVPRDVGTVSALLFEKALKRLGIFGPCQGVTWPVLARCLVRTDDVRQYVMGDIFDRARRGGPLWDRWEGALLSSFDRRVARRSFALRGFRILTRNDRFEVVFERCMSAYCDALGEASRPPKEIRVSVDRSINIGSVQGNPQISSGDGSTLEQFSISPAAVPTLIVDRLRVAAEDDDAAAAFPSLVERLAGVEGIDTDAVTEAIVAGLSGETASQPVQARLRRIAAGLSVSATGSLLAAAVLTALKALGI